VNVKSGDRRVLKAKKAAFKHNVYIFGGKIY
jgi:hypothetical protein